MANVAPKTDIALYHKVIDYAVDGLEDALNIDELLADVWVHIGPAKDHWSLP